ncbi:MAG: hypothetical protein AAB361_00105 [Patescibacteria group bacterium]
MLLIVYFSILIFLLIAIIINIIYVIFYIYQTIRVMLGQAPFVPASQKAIGRVIKEIDLKENSIVFDLGCGDSRVLIECYKKQPKARYIGIEKGFLPFIIANFKVWKAGAKKSIKIKRCDFFKENLSSATHIYTYLYPEVMNKLLPKLEKELRPGAVLASLSFVFPQKSYEKKIDILPAKRDVIKSMFIYRF